MPDQNGNPTPDEYNQYVNIAGYNAQTQRAQAEAQAAYQQALAQGATDQQALAWAKFRWQQKLDEAGQTGMWNGQWNNPQEQWFTSQFGQWYGPGGEPGVGTQTLNAQNQQFGQGQQLAAMYGQYYGPGQTPTAGTATQSAGQQAAAQAATRAGLTGYLQGTGTGNIVADAWNMLDQGTQQDYINQHGGLQQGQQAYYQNLQNAVYARARAAGQTVTPQTMNDAVYGAWGPGTETMQHQQQMFTQGLQTQQEARAAQGQQQAQTMAYLNLLSQLRGPQNYFQYQNVLGSTPGGMRDLYAAAMGQYVPGGGATTGAQPQAASLQGLMGDVSGNPYYGQGGGQLGQPNVYQGGQGSYGPQQYQYRGGANQAQTGYWQGGAAAPQTSEQAGGLAWGMNDKGQQAQTGQAWGSGIGIGSQQATPQQQAQGLGNGTNLPAPNQISAQSWHNMAPSQQQLLLSGYEAAGWNKDDVLGLMNQSLPRYATNRATAGTWRLQQ